MSPNRKECFRWSEPLKRLVLESPTDPPIDLNPARIVRTVTFFVVIPLAAMAVLFGGLAPSDHGNDKSITFFTESFIALSHIIYLCLVFSDLMLARPIYRIYRQTLLYPGLVFVAYILFAFSVYVDVDVHEASLSQYLKISSYSCFFLLYILWADRDTLE
jgi:hypothetical protein